MRFLVTVLKNALFYGLFLVGFFAFLILAGGEAEPMSLARFLALKIGAAAVVCLCYLIGRAAYRRGALPKHVMKEINDED